MLITFSLGNGVPKNIETSTHDNFDFYFEILKFFACKNITL